MKNLKMEGQNASFHFFSLEKFRWKEDVIIVHRKKKTNINIRVRGTPNPVNLKKIMKLNEKKKKF